MPLLPTPIELKVPGEVRFLRHVRLVARGVATTCGLTSEESDDFRLVVDEMASALIGSGDRTDDLTLRFDTDGGTLAVEGSTRTDRNRLSMSRQILGLLTRAHRLVRDGARLRFRVTTVFVCRPAT